MANCPTCGASVAPDARFCPNCGSALGTPAPEERKLATILFADVIGSTDLGEQLDPERLNAVLQEYFAAMARLIEQWGGTVEKYIGDAVVAAFGVPTSREDDAIRALHAATEMLAELERLNGGFETRHGVRLGIRIGVNTGEVLAPLGARPAGQFLVSGDPVNVAARLEQAAEPGTILVGERTWSVARNAFTFADPVPLTVKGKREPVIARRLQGETARDDRGVRFQAPMVGRDRELDTLLGLLDEAIETEQARLLVVSGPAGIGKSRLLREFVAAASEAHPDLSVLRGRCLAAGHGITFWALGEILRAACGISLDEPSDSAAEKLRRSANALLEPLDLRAADREATIFALATSANLALPGNPLDGMEPEAVAEEMSRAWPRFLSGLATRAPTVILVEDIHWADERLVTMLELFAARSRGRLVLVATARPEFVEAHPGFAGSEDLTVVSLRPLTETQSDRLIAELLGDSDPLHALLTDVRQKAEGNPFFLEEILQRLVDEGALVHEEGRWRATERAKTVTLPDTIQALLAARIDGLPSDEKALLQQAAVVGRVFWPGSLGRAAGNGASSELLRSLERRGLVSARPTSTIEGEREYIFRHVLIRDVAYASVPKARRARAHAETGRWIEGLVGDRLEEFGELLADHYRTAVAGEDADLAWADQPEERERIRQRAFEVLLRAGAAARHRFAVDKATTLHQQALSIATDEVERARAQEAIGDDHDALFHMDEAVAGYLEAVGTLQRAGGSAQEIGRLAVKLAKGAARWGAFREQPPRDVIGGLLADALAGEIDEPLRARVLIEQGSLVGQQLGARRSGGRRSGIARAEHATLASAMASVEEGLAVARRLDNVELLKRGNDVMQGLAHDAGDHDRVYRAAEDNAGLIDRLESPRERVDILDSLASMGLDQGRLRDALAAGERGYEIGQDVSPHERMHATFELLLAADALGEWDRLLDVAAWHVPAAASEPDITCTAVRGGPPLAATILVRRGEPKRALELVPLDETALDRDTLTDTALIARYAAMVGRTDLAMAIADRIVVDPSRPAYPDGFAPLLETLILLGRYDDVAKMIPMARALAAADVTLGPFSDRAEAQLAIHEGRESDARGLLSAALAAFKRLEMPFEVARTHELLGTMTDGEERIAHLGEAKATYERLGARPFVEGVQAALAQAPA